MMIVTIPFKTPDTVERSIRQALWEEIGDSTDEDEFDARVDEIKEQLKPWIQHNEHIVVEFNLAVGLATVRGTS
jgi:hypothetical protein